MATLSDVRVSTPAYSSNTYLLVPIVLLFVLLIIAVLRSPALVSGPGIGSAVIVTAPLILATYALMAVAIAGRGTIDLSVGPLLGFINVTLVQLFGADIVSSPLGFFAYAIAVGVVYQFIMGLIIIFVRVQPIIVALSGYLALSGINLVIMSRPEGTAPEWMSTWGAGTTIYSPVLIIIILATAAWLVFTRSAFYGHLRLMGADERAAYTSGVRINLVRLGAHMIAGIFSGLAALTFTSLIGSGDPTQGTTYTLIAVTALVLGGTSLAGGRGGVFGSLLGAVNLFLIGYVLSTFSFGAVQGFVTDLAYGIILVLSLLLTVAIPYIQARIRRISPFLVFIVLLLIFLGVILHATFRYAKLPEPASAVVAEVQVPVTPLGEPVTTEPVAAVSEGAAPVTAESSVTESTAASPSVAVTGVEPAPISAPPPFVEPPVAATAPVPQRAPRTFMFEEAEEGLAIEAPVYGKPLMIAAILLVAFVIILRVSVAEIRRNTMTPILYGVIVATILLGLYYLPDYLRPAPVQKTSQVSQ
jgi:ribose transport system permease protein